MNYFKISIGILLALSASRFIPHPPNFTSLIALSFYVPAFFGRKYIFALLLSFFITDLIIGFHNTLFFTWGSIVLIGYISNFFIKNINYRICGVLFSAFIFFVVSNFGVWFVSGFYDYNFNGLIECYLMAIPFFNYTLISTLLFSLIIELVHRIFYKSKYLQKKF